MDKWIEKWQLEKAIGHGAYGTVYLVTLENRSDLIYNECAAVKVCRREDIGDERYARELRGAKLFRTIPPQEGLVHMRELVETEWGFYTVLDLADDEFGRSLGELSDYRPKTLASVIEGEKALPLKECVKLALSLAEALSVLQRHHLLHRDIKPANVLYFKGRPALSDPGLVVEEDHAVSTVGTPGYVPPEGKFTDAASDIYSLGLTLKAASFGRQLEDLDKGPAMEADTSSAFFPAWWRILNKATDPTPSRRYQSAKALIKDLENLRRKMAVAAIIGSRAVKVALALVLIGTVAAIVSSVIIARRAKDETARQSVELKQIKVFQDQKKLAKYINDTKIYLGNAIKETLNAYRASRRLYGVFQYHIDKAADTEKKNDLIKVQPELLDLRKKMRDVLIGLYRLQRSFEKEVQTVDNPTRQAVEEKVIEVQKLLTEGAIHEKRICEIGGLIYGDGWQPDPIWSGMAGDFGDEQSIRRAAGLPY